MVTQKNKFGTVACACLDTSGGASPRQQAHATFKKTKH